MAGEQTQVNVSTGIYRATGGLQNAAKNRGRTLFDTAERQYTRPSLTAAPIELPLNSSTNGAYNRRPTENQWAFISGVESKTSERSGKTQECSSTDVMKVARSKPVDRVEGEAVRWCQTREGRHGRVNVVVVQPSSTFLSNRPWLACS